MIFRVIRNTSYYNLDNKNMLREVTVKVLLDSGVTELVISSEFARKQKFKLKKIERLIYVRNVNNSFNKERPIKYMVKVNIYQGHRKK